ncbi:hypothetical protein AVEN_86128-1 [Araneus ventricosus]|uniref:Uncharacterized protein n=1 Tax=Araneus ventricosus TaxID=182803 RepID=A0A4Y2P5T6_ARAVE|nr:hypothetical protein AVEN_86128-1 [Araneus ventricosus]
MNENNELVDNVAIIKNNNPDNVIDNTESMDVNDNNTLSDHKYENTVNEYPIENVMLTNLNNCGNEVLNPSNLPFINSIPQGGSHSTVAGNGDIINNDNSVSNNGSAKDKEKINKTGNLYHQGNDNGCFEFHFKKRSSPASTEIKPNKKMNAETTQKKYLQLADIDAGEKTPSPLAAKIYPYMLKRTAEYKEILKRLNDVNNIKCKTE